MALESFERETCFGWDKSTKTCQLITFDQVLDRKLMGYCKKYPGVFKMVSEQIFENVVEGHEFEFPKKLITIRTPSKKKEMSEEEKKIAGERLNKARKVREKKVKVDVEKK
jgi:hypothetical protein